MTSPGFRWPYQLGKIAKNPINRPSVGERYVLVSRKINAKSGRHKTSSTSDGLIDIAAAVELGLMPSAGLPGLLLHVNRGRVIRLLKHNTVVKMKAKKSTVQGTHQTRNLKKLAEKALPAMIGPAYWSANKHLGAKFVLNSTRTIAWIKSNLENRSSMLCANLVGTSYEDLIGLRRNKRWWLDLFDIREKCRVI